MKPNILYLDIELAPIEAFVWSPWDQNIAPNQVKRDWSILSFAYKAPGASKTAFFSTRGQRDVRKDKSLCRRLYELLNWCDILITHNGKKFDVKKINARLIKHGFPEPSHYAHIDTLQLAKKKFGFTFNSLEHLAKFLGVAAKYKSKKFIGQDLWTACLAKNSAAWDEMEKYNKQDILTGLAVYEKLKPWGTGINWVAYGVKCCKSPHLIKQKRKVVKKGWYQQYQCKSCGSWFSDKENLIPHSKKRLSST